MHVHENDFCFLSQPLHFGAGGVERIIEVKLNGDEQKLMDTSTSHVKELVDVVKKLYPDLG